MEYISKYSPNKQSLFCTNSDLCITGNSLTLSELDKEYGKLSSNIFLVPHLTDIAIFSNCREVMTDRQVKELAAIITVNYYYLKVTEIMLFCFRFKSGRYGTFYGSVSPMTIMIALSQFIRERNEAIFRIESEERKQRSEQERRYAVSYEEYLKLKQINNEKDSIKGNEIAKL